MTPQEYVNKWIETGDNLSPLSNDDYKGLSLKPDTIAYLEVGLPQGASPYLNFVNDYDPHQRLVKLESLYDLVRKDYNKYIFIGSDVSGNLIAINVQQDDVIVWFDHEDDFTTSYFNNSIESLITFLIIYRSFVDEVILAGGEDAYLEANFTDEQYNIMKRRMLMVDPYAVNERGFWKEELDRLLIDRDYYRANP